MIVKPLQVDQLYQNTDPELFSFDNTEQLEDLTEIIGQPRAVEAVLFGTGMQSAGYNIYALGPPGTGKRTLILKQFQEQAAQEAVPQDWCYIHNFDQDHKPKAISLPPGAGSKFQADMDQFVEELQSTLATAFESDEYRTRRRIVESEIEERQEAAFEQLQEKAQKENFALLRTPAGLVFAPIKEGEVIPPEEFKKLPEEMRQEMEKHVQELQKDLQTLMQQIPIWQREMRSNITQLNHEITQLVVSGLLEVLHADYGDHPQVIKFLEAVQADVVDNAGRLLERDLHREKNGIEPAPARPSRGDTSINAFMRRYKVNLLVNNASQDGGPVIFEDNPTYQNLIGRVENVARMGTLTTDFTLIKPGSLHLANGGYLVLDARKVLLQPYVWDALKRALDSRQVRIETPSQMLGILSTASLEPEPIPLDVKIALLGDRMLYYLLYQSDPEFKEHFKVQADFAEQITRSNENQQLYAQMIATLARSKDLRPLDKGAVARVIEHCARQVGDAEKLTIQVNAIVDLLQEAEYWARDANNPYINAGDIQKAIDGRVYRADRIREHYQENILRDTIMITTEGSQVGQINGLSVVQLGDFSFGFPSRITASVRRGKGDVIDIEREVELSGPLHSKGVLILAGFLGQRFASKETLALSASLVFEQSYSGVEGDSASSAELYALLSSISEASIKQSLAVTGSVNQHGLIQAIGGVNEKIEGFFDICKERGLSGEHGVLIPAANVKHLMLRQDVREAADAGFFSIYPVETIDQGIELLTGIPMGLADEDGNYSTDSISSMIQSRLKKLADKGDSKSDEKSGSKS